MANAYHRGKRVSPAHAAMLKAYERKHGTLYINQGRRTIAEQTRFWLHYLRYGSPLAARPFPGAPHIKYGKQHHALDINDGIVDRVAAFYRAHDVPVAFNVPREPWHMDTLSEPALIRAAKRVGGTTRPTLKRGMKGPSVVKAKRRLRKRYNLQGYNSFSPFFDKKFQDAVKRWQRRHNLSPDGVIGQRTWNKMGL